MSVHRGVHGPGGYIVPGGVWSWGVHGPGGLVHGPGGCMIASVDAD